MLPEEGLEVREPTTHARPLPVLVKIGCVERVLERVLHFFPTYRSLLILGKYCYFHRA